MSKTDAAETFADESFVTPETVEAAWRFGRSSGFCGHARLNHEQFFRHDPFPRPYGTTGLYRAYRKGFDQGRVERVRRDERRAIEERGRR